MTLGELDALDPHDYGILIADWEREQDQCAKCGRPRQVCSDPETVFYPQRTVCYAEMAATWVRERYEDLHGEGSGARFHDGTFSEWSERRTADTPYAYDAGVTTWVSTEDLTPDDKFLDAPSFNGQLVSDEQGREDGD